MIRFPKLLTALTLFAALAAGTSANAQNHDMHEHAGQHMAASSQDAPDAALTAGEIRKVDKQNGRLTIQHGPLTNLSMPGMTMSFKVQDTAMLDQAQAGDKIRFRVERVNGALTVTRLDRAN
jgi:Cu(I)/Ag(I) efflux system periplasmic protein CusF